MPQLAPQQLAGLSKALRESDYLQRLADEIEHLHRVVFHGSAGADWTRVRLSAEQIVMAEMVIRHGGHAEGVLQALRALENAGRSWDAAVRQRAAEMHSYYTTPLGVVMRHDLFGEAVVFFSPEAYAWTVEFGGRGPQREARKP